MANVGEIQIGDTVRVRDWDEMMEEYGGDEITIEAPYVNFIDDMKRYCGRDNIVKDIIKHREYDEIILSERFGGFTWSNFMFDIKQDIELGDLNEVLCIDK